MKCFQCWRGSRVARESGAWSASAGSWGWLNISPQIHICCRLRVVKYSTLVQRTETTGPKTSLATTTTKSKSLTIHSAPQLEPRYPPTQNSPLNSGIHSWALLPVGFLPLLLHPPSLSLPLECGLELIELNISFQLSVFPLAPVIFCSFFSWRHASCHLPPTWHAIWIWIWMEMILLDFHIFALLLCCEACAASFYSFLHICSVRGISLCLCLRFES